MQAIKIWIKWIGLFCIFLQSCVYEYNPELNKYSDLLVVYGMITNEKGPHEIMLTRTTSVYGNNGKVETNANVTILDDQGNSITLVEKTKGKYQTPDNFAGIVGNSYKLSITISDGKHYESDFVKLIDVPAIKVVTSEFKTKLNTKTGDELKGYQFYIDVDGSATEQKYYRWEMEETWEIEMPYNINYYWNGDTLVDMTFPKRCWRYGKVNEMYIANTQEYQSNSIKNLPLNFTTTETERLSVKYRLSVNQYALSEKSYFFWKGQVENTQQQGSLYDKQPYQVVGNIKSIDNSNEIVLGIFEASAVSSKQIFVKRPNIFVPFGFETCVSTPLSNLTDLEKRRPYYASFTIMDSIVVTNKQCVDCKATGSIPTMPENWE